MTNSNHSSNQDRYKYKYETFGNVIRQVKDEMSLHERHLEIVKKQEEITKANSGVVTIGATGKPSRHNLVKFPNFEPLCIRGREFTRLGIARMVGCDIGHISKVFTGQRTPSLFMARKIANVIGLTTDEFYDLLTRIDVGQDIAPEDRAKRPLKFIPITGNPDATSP